MSGVISAIGRGLRKRQEAKENGFDFFGTTLSISPHKNAEKLNLIGEELGAIYGVEYLYGDFKKKNGYKRSIELSKIYGLYRQDYCGCVFSARYWISNGDMIYKKEKSGKAAPDC